MLDSQERTGLLFSKALLNKKKIISFHFKTVFIAILYLGFGATKIWRDAIHSCYCMSYCDVPFHLIITEFLTSAVQSVPGYLSSRKRSLSLPLPHVYQSEISSFRLQFQIKPKRHECLWYNVRLQDPVRQKKETYFIYSVWLFQSRVAIISLTDLSKHLVILWRNNIPRGKELFYYTSFSWDGSFTLYISKLN